MSMDAVAASAGVGAGLAYLLHRVIRNEDPNEENRDELEQNMNIEINNDVQIELEAVQRNEIGVDEGVFEEDTDGDEDDEDEDDEYRTPNVGEGDYPVAPQLENASNSDNNNNNNTNNNVVNNTNSVNIGTNETNPLNNVGVDSNFEIDIGRRLPKKRNPFTHTTPTETTYFPVLRGFNVD